MLTSLKSKMLETVEFVRTAHGDQMYGDQPYISHLLRVAMMCDTAEEKIVALLHDVVEDTSISIFDIRGWYEPEIADAVDCLTHGPYESYDAYLTRIESNQIARNVKIKDLCDNIFHAENVYKQYAQRAKTVYYPALMRLTRHA